MVPALGEPGRVVLIPYYPPSMKETIVASLMVSNFIAMNLPAPVHGIGVAN